MGLSAFPLQLFFPVLSLHPCYPHLTRHTAFTFCSVTITKPSVLSLQVDLKIENRAPAFTEMQHPSVVGPAVKEK